MYLLLPKGYESIRDPINLKMKAELNFETSVTITQLMPQHSRMPACFLDKKAGLQLQ